MNKQNYLASDVIFLLGTGASVDAGMPLVKDLTHCIREQLPDLKDINGNRTLAFKDIFDSIANIDSEVTDNYEKFFNYIHLITTVSKNPQKGLFCVKLPNSLVEKVGHLPYIIGDLVKTILNEFQNSAQPDYLSGIADFIPAKGRLKVFTLNYDLCIETTCKNRRVSFTTGFDQSWKPELFNNPQQGINLYKLHGCLSWPEIILGPGNKIQADDPFLTLFYEFHKAVHEAKVCVVIGHSYQDDHIRTVLEKGKCPVILDVNTQSNHCKFGNLGCKRIEITGSTRELLKSGAIKKKLEEILKNDHKKL